MTGRVVVEIGEDLTSIAHLRRVRAALSPWRVDILRIVPVITLDARLDVDRPRRVASAADIENLREGSPRTEHLRRGMALRAGSGRRHDAADRHRVMLPQP
jgi:hypothetical protein